MFPAAFQLGDSDVGVCFLRRYGKTSLLIDGIIEEDIVSLHGIDLSTTRKVLTIRGEQIPIVNWRADVFPSPAYVLCKEKTIDSALSVRLCGMCRIPTISKEICWAKLEKSCSSETNGSGRNRIYGHKRWDRR